MNFSMDFSRRGHDFSRCKFTFIQPESKGFKFALRVCKLKIIPFPMAPFKPRLSKKLISASFSARALILSRPAGKAEKKRKDFPSSSLSSSCSREVSKLAVTL